MRGLVVVMAVALLVTGGVARADEPYLAADASRVGEIDLYYFATPGSEVTFAERVGSQLVELGRGRVQDGDNANLRRAATWRCDRRSRRFEAVGTTAEGAALAGSFDVRTPSCRDRVAISVRRGSTDRDVVISLGDRWGLGAVPIRVCVDPPHLGRRCVRADLGSGQAGREIPWRVDRTGQWEIQVRFDHYVHRENVRVRPGRAPVITRASRPTILVTGDSTAQGVDAHLGSLMGTRGRVERDFRVGTGVGHSWFDWVAVARSQADRLRPTVTVVSIGANDDVSMTSPAGQIACCSSAWQNEYRRRVSLMMRSYRRRGRAEVLWLTLPIPQDKRRQGPTIAVNAAVRRAAVGLDGVDVVPLDDILTPGGAYRRTVRIGGRAVVVRAPDGVHLSDAGTALAAQEIMKRVRGFG